jgi:hypothetical protein
VTRDGTSADDEAVERAMTVLVSSMAALLPGPVRRGKNWSVRRHQQVMTAHQLHTAPHCGSGPPVDVQSWRRCRLVEAGFPPALADLVSSDSRYDLHALLRLVDRGCPPELAVAIIAPLPREPAP